MVNKPNKPALNRTRLRTFLLSDNFLSIMAIFIILIISALFLIPVTYEKNDYSILANTTEYKDESAIELGTETIAKVGQDGQRIVTIKYSQSLFNYLFRKSNVEKEVLKNQVIKNPENKIVLNGTKKWQYMICSDGSSRYYTDEQFKDPKIGFTSKSEDYCAKNGQGKKVSLSDAPSGKSNTSKPTYVPSGCSVIYIPYKTVYQEADWINVGEIREGYGYNGYKIICRDGSYMTTYPATDKIVYRGTKPKQETVSANETIIPGPDSAAKQKCDSDYSYAKAQISMAGGNNSSAIQYLNTLHLQCLARAGF
jgi:hypothetical protein